MNKQLKCLLIIVFFAILIISCDLFTGPKDDLFRTISNEADWANAEKLTVRLEYPSAWGTSNPVQGTIAMDIRKGFEFSLEFTTGNLYTLQSWQAYRTSELESLGNWQDFPALINPDKIQALGSGDVTLPAPVAEGGTFKFIINTSDPVTLIPWCDDQPRIVRTEPRNNPDGAPYSEASDIVIYFNCAFNTDTAKFAPAENADGIWITAKSSNSSLLNKDMNWFYKPEYAAVDGFFTVTISPKAENPPPSDSLITVTVKGIASGRSGKKDDKGYSFSWKTKKEGESKRITLWSATNYSINSNKSQINIHANTNINDDEWNSNAGKYYLKLYYRIDNGTRNLLLIGNKDVINKKGWIIRQEDYNVQYIGQINNVSIPDDKGVREGRPISGISEYTIIIELYEGKIEVDQWGNVTKIVDEGIIENKVSFKIWNIPDMRVTNTNPAVEIRTEAELAAMKDNLGGQYVLANDIFVFGAWNPVGKYDESNPKAAFHGKFYGNGHTIILNNSVNAYDYSSVGLFGRIANINSYDTQEDDFDWASYSVIRDFNILLDGTVYNGTAVNFGGVAGTVYGTPSYRNGVVIRNIITGGAIKVEFDTALANKYLGGIAGYLEGDINVINCHVGTDIEILSDKGEGDIYIGGVAGCSSGSWPMIEVNNIRCSGSIDSMSRETWITKPMQANSIIAGGIIGEIRGTRVVNTDKIGSLLITKTKAKDIKAGGIVGNVKKGEDSSISNSYFLKGTEYTALGIIISDNYAGVVLDSDLSPHENVFAGGVVGNIEMDALHSVGISRCYSNTEIIIAGNLPRYFHGYIEDMGSFQVSDSVYVGGLAGRLAGEAGGYAITLNNCYALGEHITAFSSGNIYAGGLMGYMDMKNNYKASGDPFSYVEYTFSSFRTIRAQKTDNTGKVYTGGIVGYLNKGVLMHSASLCQYIYAKGGGTSERAAVRVYGGKGILATDPVYEKFSNYADDNMFLLASDYDADDNDTIQNPSNTGEKEINGKSTVLHEFTQSDIWINTLHFNSGYNNNWDFSAISVYNHPKLTGLGGQ